MANYKLDNFLATPSPQDTRMRIYDKNSKLRYTIDPNVAYFYKKANIDIIKVEDRTDIFLDFASSTEAAQALAKLNDAKKTIIENDCPIPPTPPVSGLSIYSKSNLNIPCNVTVNDGDLACVSVINDTPLQSSRVRVFVNGVEVNVGEDKDCYFSIDGGLTPRIVGDERQGDELYWNGSIAEYELDDGTVGESGLVDFIDFIYLIEDVQ